MSTYALNSATDYRNIRYPRKDLPAAPETDLCVDQPYVHLNIPGFLNQLPCVNWVLDVQRQTYTFISDNTFEYFGYPVDNYISKGAQFQDEIKHPEDRSNARNLLREVWRILQDISPDFRSDYRFNYDYRIVKPDGKVIRVLEQNSILQQDEYGNVTRLLGVCSDITEWKKNGTQLASLTSVINKQCFLFSAENITPAKPEMLLSRRELEIVKLISEGHSSKFIADKLFISFHTVNTHRKKMIDKTKTRNASGLVQFAICNGLI